MSRSRPCGERYQQQSGTTGWWRWRKPRFITLIQPCRVDEPWREGVVEPCARGCGRLLRAVATPWEGHDDLGASDRVWYAHGIDEDWVPLTDPMDYWPGAHPSRPSSTT